jgi:hypothetical protein
MQDDDVRADVINSQGKTVGTVPVGIARRPDSFALRQLADLRVGVYFLEWYVNHRFLIRVPVQIRSLAPALDQTP